MFDLDQLDTRTRSEEGVWMDVLSIETGLPMTNRLEKPLRIMLLGPDSKVYRSITKDQVRKRLQESAIAKSSGKDQPNEMDAGEADALDTMVKCTVKWEHFDTREGTPIACTPANVRALYEGYPIIRDQVDVFISRRVNFLLASSKGSSPSPKGSSS